MRRRRVNRRRQVENPRGGGIGAIVMDGLWVGIGMYAGGMIGGLINPLTGSITGMLGPFGGLAQGLIVAYAVDWLGSRVGGHGPLMAAGAMAGPIVGTITGFLGGGLSSLTGGSATGGGSNAGGPSAPPTGAIGSAPVAQGTASPLSLVQGNKG